MTLTRLVLLGVLLIVSAVIVGWADVEIPSPTVGPSAARVPGALQDSRKPNVENDLRILAERRPWGADLPTAQSAPTAASNVQTVSSGSWRIGGIMRIGDADFLVLLVQPQPNATFFFRYLTVGDSLPDGQVIERMADDSVQVRKGDQSNTLRLYRRPSG